jgi:hypothetical protein
LPASGAAAASTAATITTNGVSTAVDAAGLIVVFPAAASVSDAMLTLVLLIPVHAYEKRK